MDVGSRSLRKTTFLVVALSCLTSACSEGEDPALPDSPVDFVGTWSVTEMASFLESPPDTLMYDMVVTQGDSLLEIQIEGDLFTGTVEDRTLTVSGGTLRIPFCSSGDRFVKGSTFTMDATGNAFSGSSDWCCPSDAIACALDGTSTLTATRPSN